MVVHLAVSEGKTEMFCEAATRRDGHFGFGVPSRNSGEKNLGGFALINLKGNLKLFKTFI